MLNFVVIRDYNGKPIRNASVVMHPVEKNGKQSRAACRSRPIADGKASFDGVPYGKLRVQVLATGFQTFGDDYAIDKPTMEITVKMKRPAGAIFHLRRPSGGEERRAGAAEAARQRFER